MYTVGGSDEEISWQEAVLVDLWDAPADSINPSHVLMEPQQWLPTCPSVAAQNIGPLEHVCWVRKDYLLAS